MTLGKILFSLLLLSLVALGFWYFFFKEEKITNTPITKERSQVTILAIGDSLVQGVGAPERKGLVDQVSRQIGIPILNYGISGNTSAQTLARLETALSEKPDIVIVLVGGNDALQKVPPIETFENITLIVSSFQKNGAVVLLLGVKNSIFSDAYKQEFDRIAKEKRTLYVPDVLSGLLGDSRYMADLVHPNEQGYTIIANKVTKELEKVLPR